MSKSQEAKSLYEQLRKNEEIDILFSGLYKDIWVTGKRTAYRVVDLGMDHLSNIIEYARTKGEDAAPAILVAYELKKKFYTKPDYIELSSLAIHSVRRRMYIADPKLVPPELKDKNILEVQEPIQVTAVLMNGKEVPVILKNTAQQLVITSETVGPDNG